MTSKKETMVYGINAVGELIRVRGQAVTRLLVDASRGDKRIADLLDRAGQQKLPTERVDRAVLDRLLHEAGETVDSANDGAGAPLHQGVLAYCTPVEARDEQFLKSLLANTEQAFLLLLDGVTDPHNLGACLRSANAAGVDAVIVPKDNAVGLTPVVRKVACGAAELTPLVRVGNLARCMKQLQEAGVWLMGAAGETDQSLYDLDLRGPLAMVMGAEGRGLRRLTRERCDQLYAIPMAGEVESLNVSVATGISLFEALRQRQAKHGGN